MLNVTLNRSPLSRATRAGSAIAVAAVLLPLAGFAAQGFGTFRGTVTDQTGGVMPKTTLVATHIPSNTRQTVETDGAGAFEFVGLRPGDYKVDVRAMGFATLLHEMSLSPGQVVNRGITLQLGSLQETITLVHSDRNPGPLSTSVSRPIDFKETPCTPSAVGGRIKPPLKLADKKPVYPRNLYGSGIAGQVLMDARIGTDGTVRDVQVVSTPDPDLGAAGVEAVRQWRFSRTLLNCMPVEVTMKVTTNFRVE